jgi:hypothetical protein
MGQELILEEWLRRKLSFRHYWRLREPNAVDYEYKERLGHPSSYAYVRFECQPAERLSFSSTASWPNGLTADWVSEFEASICEGIVDGLVCVSVTPFSGCSLNLVSIKYDEVSSSGAAFYKATKGAMAEFIKTSRWDVWPPDYLGSARQ